MRLNPAAADLLTAVEQLQRAGHEHGAHRLLFRAMPGPGRATVDRGAVMLPLDISETHLTYRIEADLPGVHRDDLHVELKGRLLTIAGERKPPTDEHASAAHVAERAWGPFVRRLHLPSNADPESIVVSYENGVLLVELHKKAAESSRRIAVE